MAILKDWKTWAIAIAAAIVANLIAAALSFSPTTGSAGAGAGIGIYIATQLGRMRTCPTCSKTVAFPPV